MRIWLKVRRDRDAALIEEQIGNEYQIIRGESFDLNHIDLCIIDRPSWPDAQKKISSIRERQEPLTVPILLLTNSKYLDKLPRETLEAVSEILRTPLQTKLFKIRLQSLRQFREDSLRLHQQKMHLNQFREAMDSANSGIVMTDHRQPDEPIIYANKAFEEITGYSREEVRGRNCRFLQGEDRNQRELETVRNSMEKGESCRVTLRNYTKTGNLFWNDMKLAPVRDEEGIITHHVGIQQDITDQVEARRQVEEKQQQWSALVNQIPDAVMISTGEEGEIEYINQAGAYMYGAKNPSDLLGYTILELIQDSPDYERVKEYLKKITAGEKVPLYTISVNDINGEERHLELRSTPIQYKNEYAKLTLARDITHKHENQQKLNREYHRFSQLFTNDPSGIAKCDPDGTIQAVNPAFKNIFGYDEDELIGQNLDQLLTRTEAEQKEAEEFTKLHREGAPQKEVIRYDKQDNPVDVLVGGAPIREKGKLTQFYAIYVDLSRQKELERRNRELLEQEQTLRAKAEESRSKFKDMFRSSPSGICLLEGPEHLFTYANERYFELTQKSELLGKTVKEAFPEIESQGFYDLLDEVYENQEPYFAYEQPITLWSEWEKCYFEKYIDFAYKPLSDNEGQTYGVFVEALDVTDKVEYRKELQDKLREKETLLEEIHHRVKNNMAVISGLLYMQAEETDNEAVRHTLQDSLSRIQSMALVHEQLYQQSEKDTLIYMDQYLPRLAETVEASHNDKADNKIQLKVDSELVKLPLPLAVPVGLITSELLINAYKHAFKDGNDGIIRVKFKEKEGKLELTVSDDGVGLPAEFSLDSTSLGIQIIQNLATQIEGEISYTSDEKEGTTFVVSFSKNEE